MKYKCNFKILNKFDLGNGTPYQRYSAFIYDTKNNNHDLSLISGFCESVLITNIDLINKILEGIELALSKKENVYNYYDEYCEVHIYKDKTFVVDGVSYESFDIQSPPGDCIDDCNYIETTEFKKIIEWWKSNIQS